MTFFNMPSAPSAANGRKLAKNTITVSSMAITARRTPKHQTNRGQTTNAAECLIVTANVASSQIASAERGDKRQCVKLPPCHHEDSQRVDGIEKRCKVFAFGALLPGNQEDEGDVYR